MVVVVVRAGRNAGEEVADEIVEIERVSLLQKDPKQVGSSGSLTSAPITYPGNAWPPFDCCRTDREDEMNDAVEDDRKMSDGRRYLAVPALRHRGTRNAAADIQSDVTTL